MFDGRTYDPSTAVAANESDEPLCLASRVEASDELSDYACCSHDTCSMKAVLVIVGEARPCQVREDLVNVVSKLALSFRTR